MGLTHWRGHRVIVLLAVLGTTGRAAADDALPAETLGRLKAATVFLKVDAGADATRGSGFVIKTDGTTVYAVTNHHVLDLTPGAPDPAVTVVFNSGGKDEQSARGEVVAADDRRDLAVVKVAGVKNPPPAIDLAQPAGLRETLPVYILGFPLGELLATNRGNPAVTVGRGSVASLRYDERGDLATVQIDGDMTPGNSGGPVVDGQGRLVGVTVATVRNRRIGFAIPPARLTEGLKGRLLDYHFVARPGAAGALDVRVELGVFDPFDQLKGVSYYYVPRGKPADKKLAGLPGAQKVDLERGPRQLVGRFTVRAAAAGDARVSFQAVYTAGDAHTFVTNVVERTLSPRSDGLAPPPRATAGRPAPEPPPAREPAGPAVPTPRAPPDTRGKTTVDLVPLFDPTKDVVHGEWEVKNKALVCTGPGKHQRVQFPYRPPEEYDLVVVFSQPRLRHGIALLLPNPNGGTFWWELGANGRDYHLGVDKTGVSFVSPKLLDPNTAYTTVVQVRRDGVRCLLNGKELVNHKTDYRDLTEKGEYRLHDAAFPGVACADPTYFHYVRLVEITGTGSKAAP